MGKNLRKKIWLVTALFLVLTSLPVVQAAEPSTAAQTETGLARNPSECSSKDVTIEGKTVHRPPSNCLFLEEPVGGETGYDLYTYKCTTTIDKETSKATTKCEYKLWNGGFIPPDVSGPVQAILTSKEGAAPGPFTLLYNYTSLIYKYMSGIIVGFVVLFVIIGGIQITTSGGDEAKMQEGRKRITQAIAGMIIWFLASVILYTINPTFFTF